MKIKNRLHFVGSLRFLLHPDGGKTVLEQEGKTRLALERVLDASIVEEVLRERR